MEVKIKYVSWVKDPFSANVQGHTKKDNGYEWDWDIPFHDPFDLIGFLCENITKANIMKKEGG